MSLMTIETARQIADKYRGSQIDSLSLPEVKTLIRAIQTLFYPKVFNRVSQPEDMKGLSRADSLRVLQLCIMATSGLLYPQEA
jgi:hypothetical protein